MNRHNVSSSRALILLILSFVVITGILEAEFTGYAMGQNTTGPGGIDLPPSGDTTGPGGIDLPPSGDTTGPEGIDLPPSGDTTGPEGIDLPPSDNATETTLATTTTSTSTYSSTKGGFHISTTITNTTTVIPVQP
jgi:hypothetical protein